MTPTARKKWQEGISPLDFKVNTDDYRLGMIKDIAKLVP